MVPELNEVRSDFNGDGWPDLAVSESQYVNGEYRDSVHVLFGVPRGGFGNVGSQYFDQTTPGLPNDDGSPDPHSEDGDLGSAFGSGDFDHDGFDDLAIGSTHDRFRVLYGGPSGLSTARARMVRLGDVAPYADTPGDGFTGENFFGSAFTTGDFDGDGTDDLVVGAPRADSARAAGWAGGVALFRGTRGGLSPEAARWIPGDAPGLPVSPELDGFGAVLAAADFNRDGRDDLAVGFDRDTIGEVLAAGSVLVLPGVADGLSIAAAQIFTQDTPGVPDAAEEVDGFGHALAAGDITGDGYADLVVNAYREGFSRGGSLTVLRGSPAGLTVDGAQYWTQLSPGVPGSDAASAFFGSQLAFGDFDHDGWGDVAAASPEENVGGLDGAGAITVLRGSPQGLTVAGLRRLAWTDPGMPASARSAYFYLGEVLHTVRQPDGGASLVVGLQHASVSNLELAGMVAVFHGTRGTQATPGGVTVNGLTTWSAADLPSGAQAFGRFGALLG